ncbi:MAG: class I SAM-dependent methyltransferase [Candidatus Riflebacteria bacterium]|nr:class I SAM-dependent methyltransferase [Candidatus Riflebacteria bacterium]
MSESDFDQEKNTLAYSFYSILYGPLALLNLIAVWRGSIGKQLVHYQNSLELSKGDILDTAIGDGSLSALVYNKFRKKNEENKNRFCIGLDISPDMLRKAEVQFAPVVRKSLRFLLLRADAKALPFSDRCFNQVFCYGGLHSIPAPEKVLKEFFRALRPGGFFAGSVLLTPRGWLGKKLAGKYLEWGTLSNDFSFGDVEKLFISSGFTDLLLEKNGETLLIRAKKP